MLEKAEVPVTPVTEIEKRLEVIAGNEGLSQAFSCFWLVVLPFCENDDTSIDDISAHSEMRLTKKGYCKFNRNMYIALTDNRNLESQKNYVEMRWSIDMKHMSVLEAVQKQQEKEEARERDNDRKDKKLAHLVLDENTDESSNREHKNRSEPILMSKAAFFNSLYDILDVWAEMLDPKYYAVFAWSLLNSIADTNVYPPKLREPNQVTCTTTLDNEAAMWELFVKTGEVRHSLSLSSKAMAKVPEVLRRLAARKKGTTLSNEKFSFYIYDVRKNEKSGPCP